jgi:hypothetical protein
MHRIVEAFPSGTTVVDRWGDLTHTVRTTGATLAASYASSATRSIGGQTSIGYDRLGSDFVASDSQRFSWSGAHYERTSSGPWLRQQFAWQDRFLVGGALRWERREAFGAKAPSASFKSADALWSLGDVGRFEALRFRAAYGEGGSWTAGNPGAFSSPDGLFADVSRAEPKERTSELEVGLDAKVGEAVTLGLTAFQSNSSHLYVAVFSPPGLGQPFEAVLPVGKMRNEGFELNATTRVLDRGSLRWDASLSATTRRNRVRSTGDYTAGPRYYGRALPGYPAGNYWTTPYTFSDANHDGIIDASEVHMEDDAKYVGSSLPTREVGLRSTLSIGSRLTVGALLDYRGGQKLANMNENVRCRIIRNCRAAQDPTAPLADQAAVIASRNTSWIVDPYIEDASFLKLRELSLTWSVPARWSSSLAGTNAAVTLAGRNLVTWTGYKGLDPELDYRRLDQLPREDMAKTPLLREVVLRLEIGGATRK